MSFCPSCGRANHASANFCSYCGQSLRPDLVSLAATTTPHYDFLKPNEEVIHSIEFSDGVMVATDKRVVVRRSAGTLTRQTSIDDFDYRYLAHIGLEHRSHVGMGVLFITIGIVAMLVVPAIGFLLGLVLILAGVVLIARKTAVVTISISGVPKQFEYRARGDRAMLERFISSVRDARSRIAS